MKKYTISYRYGDANCIKNIYLFMKDLTDKKDESNKIKLKDIKLDILNNLITITFYGSLESRKFIVDNLYKLEKECKAFKLIRFTNTENTYFSLKHYDMLKALKYKLFKKDISDNTIIIEKEG